LALAEPAAAPPTQTPAARAGFERMLETSLARAEKLGLDTEMKGTGPFPARMEMDLALPNFTVYRPADLSALRGTKLSVLIWGNGGCSDDGASAYKELAEIASHGFLVIAPGKPLTSPLALPGAVAPAMMKTSVKDLREALDWAFAENGRIGSPYHRRIDTAKVAVAGHSCGGMQAILMADGPRIKTLIVQNSGIVPILPDNPPLIMHDERVAGIRVPTLFVAGGESDIIWKYAVSTFQRIKSVPAFMASKDTGHGGTFKDAHGGSMARLVVNWLKWRLSGDKVSSKQFVGADCALCQDASWTVSKKNMP
jgi:pimeloyl-ACP methyl ester carboxylesterase